MIDTVYILGAGASFEVGLPTGIQLKQSISNDLNIEYSRQGYTNIISGDKDFDNCLSAYAIERDRNLRYINIYREKAREISSGVNLALSIDNYIYSKRKDDVLVDIGKLAIVFEILSAERNSLFGSDDQNEIPNNLREVKPENPGSLVYSSYEEHWYVKFFRILVQDCDLDQLKSRLSSIRIVNFNYDRSLEHYLTVAISKFYYIPLDEASDVLAETRFIHPYGQVAPLSDVAYGKELNPADVVRFSRNIKIFHEKPEDPIYYDLLYQPQHAERVVFLGFAFHPLNLSLFKLPAHEVEQAKPSRRFIATGYGISEPNKGVILYRLRENFGRFSASESDIDLFSRCTDLFDKSSIALSFVPYSN